MVGQAEQDLLERSSEVKKEYRPELFLDREYTGKELALMVIIGGVLFAIGYGLMVLMGTGVL